MKLAPAAGTTETVKLSDAPAAKVSAGREHDRPVPVRPQFHGADVATTVPPGVSVSVKWRGPLKSAPPAFDTVISNVQGPSGAQMPSTAVFETARSGLGSSGVHSASAGISMVSFCVQHNVRPFFVPSTTLTSSSRPLATSSTVMPGAAPAIVHSSVPPPAGTTCAGVVTVTPGVSELTSIVRPACSAPTGIR